MTLLKPLALTMGEPAGVGGEIALAAWLAREGAPEREDGEDAAGEEGAPLPPFFVIDDVHRLARLAGDLQLPVPVVAIDGPEQAAFCFAEALPVLHRPLPVPVSPGQPDPLNAPAVAAAIEEAVGLCRQGRAGAVVTNPLHKKVMQDGGFAFPGHTEFLADLAGGVPVAMMLASPLLRVVPVTIHVSLRRAVELLTAEKIVEAGRITAAALRRDCGIPRPRLAVAGLNPHAGEGGAMGDEDLAVVAPAVAALRAEGIDAFGPLPADTLFHARARRDYDVALCMYHDQALIPLKTLDFDGGVNVTLGLPFIRTSPDHGTAFDLAGSGRARPDSLMAALRLAGAMAVRRG